MSWYLPGWLYCWFFKGVSFEKIYRYTCLSNSDFSTLSICQISYRCKKSNQLAATKIIHFLCVLSYVKYIHIYIYRYIYIFHPNEVGLDTLIGTNI